MSMKKILKEWNNFLITEGRNTGLYDLIDGVEEGGLDVFLKHFKADEVFQDRVRKIRKQYGRDMRRAMDKVPPAKEEQAFKGLRRGDLYWWNLLIREKAMEIIDLKAQMYVDELASILASTQYAQFASNKDLESLNQPNQPPTPEYNAIKEAHFMKDNIDQFFSRYISANAMNNTGYVGNPGVGAGLFGQMADWYLGNEMSIELRDAIKNKISKIATNENLSFEPMPDEIPDPPREQLPQNTRAAEIAANARMFMTRLDQERDK